MVPYRPREKHTQPVAPVATVVPAREHSGIIRQPLWAGNASVRRTEIPGQYG